MAAVEDATLSVFCQCYFVCCACVRPCDCVFYEIYTYPNGPIFLLESVQMIQSVQQANVAIKAVLS